MNLRRKYLDDVKAQPMLQKALAISLYIKCRAGSSSCINDYSINKIHKLTNISPATLKKYMPIMIEQGYVKIVSGKKNTKRLIVCKLSSKHKERNISISKIKFNSFKEVFNSIRAYIFCKLQAKKNYLKRLLQLATNPKRGQNFKGARRKVRKFVSRGILKGCEVYKEYGISLKRIANELGTCVKTAQKVVNYTCEKKWIKKHNHKFYIHAPFICKQDVEGYTYSTMNYLYSVCANSYTLSKSMEKDFGMVSI